MYGGYAVHVSERVWHDEKVPVTCVCAKYSSQIHTGQARELLITITAKVEQTSTGKLSNLSNLFKGGDQASKVTTMATH